MPDPIASPANPTAARVRALLTKRDRRAEERAFVVEGRRAIADALAAGARPELLLLREGAPPPDLAEGLPLRLVAPKVFDALSDVATPQGVLAVFPLPDPAPPVGALPLVLIVDRLRDPGNLGTLLRAAAGAGATTVYLGPETVDPYNPKAVRAGMGAHFRLPLRPLDATALATLRTDIPLRVATDAEARLPYDAVDWRGPAAVVVGSEADGIGPEGDAVATLGCAIPLAAGVESLNAAVAGAVVLFEAARQRRQDRAGAAAEGTTAVATV